MTIPKDIVTAFDSVASMASVYKKRLICLANSWKTGGRCIACKEIDGDRIGDWVRPVSSRQSGELNNSEHQYRNKTQIEVGHIFEMTFDRAAKHAYQSENHVVTSGYYCGFIGKASPAQIRECLDRDTPLDWPMGFSTRYGSNDQVPEKLTAAIDETLRLIEVTDFEVHIEHEWPNFDNKRKVRGSFSHNGSRYKLGITDPIIHAEFASTKDGEYIIGHCILCISLGELDKGYAYKLIATVFRPA